MKSSAFLVAACALMATATPLGQRAVEFQVVRQTVTVTVSCDENDPTAATYVQALPEATTTSIPLGSSQAPAPPAPVATTTIQAPPPPAPEPTTTVQAPAPTTTAQAPSSPPPAPEPTTVQTPVVELAPPPQSTQSSSPSSDYSSSMLYQHNIHRANHSAPALTWNDTLAEYAQVAANTCVFAHDMDVGGGGYGQNLASWGSTDDISSLEIQAGTGGVTNQWYDDEMENWLWYGQSNPSSSANFDSIGHFSQLVWVGSVSVGCSTVMCPAGTVLSMESWYTVCDYYPPGNYGGEYGTNVLEPLGVPMVTV